MPPQLPRETFGARCAKAAALKNLIMMGSLQALADLIDAERRATIARQKAGTPIPGDEPPPAIEKPKRKKRAPDPAEPPEPTPFGDRKQIPPTPEQITAYSASIGYPLAGEEFCDFYTAKGWKVGEAKMKDWQAAVRNWKRSGWGKPLRPPTPPADKGPRKFY